MNEPQIPTLPNITLSFDDVAEDPVGLNYATVQSLL